MAPDGWKTVSLGEFVTLQRGHDLPEHRRRPGQVPILGSFGITGWHDEARSAGPGVTVGRSGASFGVVSYSPIDYWPLNTSLYVSDFHGNDPRFAYYFLKLFDFRRYNSGSAQPSLNRNFVHPAPVAVPPLKEQLAIAAILGGLDDKIQLATCINATLEALADILYDEATRANGAMGPLSEGLEVWSGGTPKTESSEYWGGAVPWISIKDLEQRPFVITTEKTITEAGVAHSAAKRLPDGSVVLSARGTVGRVSMAPQGMAVNQSCYALVGRYPLATYHRVKSAVRLLRARAHGSVFDTITRDTLHGLSVALLLKPDEFETAVRPLYERILLNQRGSQTIGEVRDLLLPKLISGDLRTRQAEALTEAAV